MSKLVEQVAANIPTPGVVSEPSPKLRDLSEIRHANAISERVRHPLDVFGGTNLALVGHREHKVKRDKQALALEGFPFSLIKPNPAGSRAAVNVKRKAMTNSVAEQQAP